MDNKDLGALPPMEDRAFVAAPSSPAVSPVPASIPSANEPGAYGIGSSHWPGVGKTVEEMNELGVVLGKLFGSGGDRNHWSGDLVQMMHEEIADVRAALDFLEDRNPELRAMRAKTISRHMWKLDLFLSWHSGAPEAQWPKPERYGLPPRPAKAIEAQRAATGTGAVHESAVATPFAQDLPGDHP